MRDSYTDFDYEHAATAIFNDILPEEKELKIVDESTPDDVELTEFDADVVERGSGGITNIKDLIASIEGDWDEGAPITEVLDQAENLGMERSQAKYEIEKLRRQGDAYEPTTDHLRTV